MKRFSIGQKISIVVDFRVKEQKIMNISTFNSVPNLLGYLVIAEDGAVIASNGELENDEKTSEIIYKLVTMSHR